MIIDRSQKKIDFFGELYRKAESADGVRAEANKRRMEQYKGSTEIDGSYEHAKTVRNITYELIESQVSAYIPTPKVRPRMQSDKNQRRAKAIETLLSNLRDRLPFERMNDIDERYNPIYGGSVYLAEWDDSIKTHNTVGDVRISCLAPTQFIGQPNIYDVQEMEYCFIKFMTTREELMRRYGVTIEKAEEAAEEDGEYDEDSVELIVCYYKDENDCVCKYVFTGDVELEDIEDYYARKVKVCKKCGKREGACECDKPKFEMLDDDAEALTEGVMTQFGEIPAESPKYRDGEMVTKEEQIPVTNALGQMQIAGGALSLPEMQTVEVPVMEQTKIPWYKPTLLPVVIRINTSAEDSMFGQSDCDAIRPQQQEINKIESRISDKINRSTVVPYVPEDCTVAVGNAVFGQVIRMKPGSFANQYGIIDTTPNVSNDAMQSERLYDQAKRILGISDSFLGQYDASAQSGKAKQIQVQQSAGRLDSKRRMKNAAYADLDAIVFQMYLAYSDEPRAVTYKDSFGKTQNILFSRYDFVERDDAGVFYYDDQFMFSADSTIDAEKDRESLWELNLQSLQSGTFGNPADPTTLLRYWMAQENAHYPYARENVEFFETQIRNMQAAQAQMLVNNAQGGAI